MIHNIVENALLESSETALLFNLKLGVFRFYATLVIEFVLHHRFSAILVVNHFVISFY